MISTQCSSCHATYNLKDEFAGKSAKCPNCQSVFQIPQITPSETQQDSNVSAPLSSDGIGSHLPDSHSLHASGVFAKHLYGIKQKRIAINEKYYIRDADNRDVFFALRRVYIWRRLGRYFYQLLSYLPQFFF